MTYITVDSGRIAVLLNENSLGGNVATSLSVLPLAVYQNCSRWDCLFSLELSKGKFFEHRVIRSDEEPRVHRKQVGLHGRLRVIKSATAKTGA